MKLEIERIHDGHILRMEGKQAQFYSLKETDKLITIITYQLAPETQFNPKLINKDALRAILDETKLTVEDLLALSMGKSARELNKELEEQAAKRKSESHQVQDLVHTKKSE